MFGKTGAEKSKSQHERTVFMEFVKAASLAVDPLSVESRPPREPDIRCRLNDELVYFELAHLLDQGMQRLKLKAMHIAPEQVSSLDYDVKLPEREILRTKLVKHYETSGAPIELLLYYDKGQGVEADFPVFGDDFGWHADQVMLPLIYEIPGKFRRVWVYERHRPSILWRHPGSLPG